MSAMWFDICVITLVVILGVKGLLSGFVKEIFGLIGLIGGVIIASRNAELAGRLIDEHLYKLNETTIYFFGFLAALIAFWVICLIAGNLLSKMISFSGLKFLDMIFGFLIGSAKIFFVLAIFVAIITKFDIINQKIEPYTKGSATYPILLESGKFIMNINVEQAEKSLENAINMGNNEQDTNNTTKE